MNEIPHWILSELSDEIRKRAEEIISEKKFENKLFGKHALTQEERELLERILEIYELTIWGAPLKVDTKLRNKKK